MARETHNLKTSRFNSCTATKRNVKYTEAQAEAKAQQIFKRFGLLIHLACANSIVPEDFLAGFTGVEAGVDRHSGQINPAASRFEKGVYHKLLSVRDGLRSSWSKITTRDLTGLSDAAIRNLATSWGLTQIMGWHLIHNLKGTIQDLRDLDKHLYFTVELLVVTAEPHILSKRFDNVLRIWNAGSANGKTFDDDYVDNALLVRKHYAAILQANRDAFSSAVEPQTLAQPDEDPPVESAFQPAADLTSQAQPPIETPAGDPPNAQPTKWFNVEDWKPLVFRWLKRIWGGNLTANAGQTFANLVGAVKDPEHWYIYVAIAVGVLILLVGAGMLVSLPLIVVWLWNRREILHLKTAEFAALADPNMKNVGLLFEKK